MLDTSPLRDAVQEGLGAVKKSHKGYFSESTRALFTDSLDIDEGFRRGREQENRWDYLLGEASAGAMIAVEPHSAKDDEVSTIIAKRQAAREQLRQHLRPHATVSRWLWVASGTVCFADTEKTRRRLDQHGIEFVGSQVQERHVRDEGGDPRQPRRSPRGRRPG